MSWATFKAKGRAPRRAVYDGDRLVGYVVGQGDHFKAEWPDGTYVYWNEVDTARIVRMAHANLWAWLESRAWPGERGSSGPLIPRDFTNHYPCGCERAHGHGSWCKDRTN